MLDEFVCVRAVQMGGVDLSLFQFDPFLSWAVVILNADRTIYGRYGSAHPKAKRSKRDSNPSHTVKGLRAALDGALEVHRAYAAEPEAWSKKLAGKTGPEPRWKYAEKTPAARKYKRLHRIHGKESEGCVHCHEVQRTAVDSYLMKKLDVPDRMLWVYPPPEALGLSLHKDHRARVTAVALDGPAGKAGLKSGDELVSLAGQPLLSIADVQWVLHNAPDEGGALPAVVKRGDWELNIELVLPEGWRREGDFCWRYRLAGYAMWLWSGVTLEDHAGGVLVAERSPGWFKRPNRKARQVLRRGDVIVSVDGETGWTRSTYLAYLMREKKLGSTVKLVVLRDGRRTKLKFKLPSEQPEVQGY